MKTILLFFFILLMATLRAVSNRENKTIQVRNQNRISCIDRTVPNKIEHNRERTASLCLDKSGKLIIKL
jgi:hypothetical protein